MKNLFYNRQLPMFLIFLVAISAGLGIFLRLSDLNAHVVWHDEVHTILRAFGFTTQQFTASTFNGNPLTAAQLQSFQQLGPSKTIADTLNALASHPEHSPLYYLMVRFTAPFFNAAIQGARLLAALSSLLLFPAVFFLTRKLFPQSRTAPWVALCLTALAPIQIIYAREARQYALYEVFVILSTCQLIQSCQNDHRWPWYGALLALGLYTHLIFGLMLATHAAFLLLTPQFRKCWRKCFSAMGAAVILFSPWLWVVIKGATSFKRHTAWMHSPLSHFEIASNWAGHIHRIFFDSPIGLTGKWISLSLILFCFFFTMFKQRRNPALILGVIIAVNVLPLVLPDILIGGRRSGEIRYFLTTLLALEFCAAFAISYRLEQSGIRRALGYAIIVGLLITTARFGHNYLAGDTWWNKNCSVYNPQIASSINKSKNPLVISDLTTISPGEVLSLSYLVAPQTKFLLLPKKTAASIPDGNDLYLFNPSEDLRKKMAQQYDLTPVGSAYNTFILDKISQKPS